MGYYLEKSATEQFFCIDYYPYGAAYESSWTRVDAKPNTYLFNGGSQFNEHTKNYETFFRQYDPMLGRFTGIDILASSFSDWTPYQYAFNDPIGFNDPTGAVPDHRAGGLGADLLNSIWNHQSIANYREVYNYGSVQSILGNAWIGTPEAGISMSIYSNGKLLSRQTTTDYIAFGNQMGDGLIFGNFDGVISALKLGTGQGDVYATSSGEIGYLTNATASTNNCCPDVGGGMSQAHGSHGREGGITRRAGKRDWKNDLKDWFTSNAEWALDWTGAGALWNAMWGSDKSDGDLYLAAGLTLIPGNFDEIAWSSSQVRKAAREIAEGATEITVKNRSQAEELFLRIYQGFGYRNTTGMSAKEAKIFFGGKMGTYHWDDVIDATGRVAGHGAGNQHGALPHLQIHTFEKDVIRIFFNP